MTERQARQEICEIGRRIWQRGMCAGNEGNHSLRVGNKVFCTPSQISKGFMKPSDVAVCNLEGKQLSGKRKRTSEIFLHLAIYNARPDIHAVVHGHPPHATAFAVAGVELPSCIHPEAEVFLGKVRTAPFVCPGDHRLGESVLPYVKETNVLLLGSHGVVTFDADLEQAYYKFEVIESYAKLLILARQLGSVERFNAEQMEGLLALKSRFGMNDPRRARRRYTDHSEYWKTIKTRQAGRR